ncbi:hypothetical protein [Pediococcus acidilactici]|uniref:hypothetical protein n=1 Tax=Pediococcus acidilactici TaxID=1254 RepID=UPI001F4D98C0|nr:hypothetical protein [Pediococcus acidilactici]MCH9267568.1 hypothetical protein [Pediococcus acidilactici]MCK2074561.1 hypothetical protein [Pediococcus acidilactici]
MKLVRVDHSKYINTDRINAVVEYNPNETHVFTGDSYEPFVFNQPIKKVLDAICGSEEHLEDSDNKYNISVTTDNTGINKIGTKSAVLHYLNKLRADEKLTIKTVI